MGKDPRFDDALARSIRWKRQVGGRRNIKTRTKVGIPKHSAHWKKHEFTEMTVFPIPRNYHRLNFKVEKWED